MKVLITKDRDNEVEVWKADTFESWALSCFKILDGNFKMGRYNFLNDYLEGGYDGEDHPILTLAEIDSLPNAYLKKEEYQRREGYLRAEKKAKYLIQLYNDIRDCVNGLKAYNKEDVFRNLGEKSYYEPYAWRLLRNMEDFQGHYVEMLEVQE